MYKAGLREYADPKEYFWLVVTVLYLYNLYNPKQKIRLLNPYLSPWGRFWPRPCRSHWCPCNSRHRCRGPPPTGSWEFCCWSGTWTGCNRKLNSLDWQLGIWYPTLSQWMKKDWEKGRNGSHSGCISWRGYGVGSSLTTEKQAWIYLLLLREWTIKLILWTVIIWYVESLFIKGGLPKPLFRPFVHLPNWQNRQFLFLLSFVRHLKHTSTNPSLNYI